VRLLPLTRLARQSVSCDLSCVCKKISIVPCVFCFRFRHSFPNSNQHNNARKNSCLYLASKFYPEECQQHPEENGGLLPDQSAAVQAAIDAATAAVELDLGSTTTPSEDFLSNHAVCLCDDDNDLEMALACGHAYLPDVSSESMRQTVESFPDHFTMTFSGTENEDGSPPTDLDAVVEGTDASDVALTMLKARILKGQQKPQQQHQALLQP